MNSASTSTASLIASSHPSSLKKNYEQAFGDLSSSFGFAGSVVSAPRVQNSSSSTSRQQQTRGFFSPSAEKQKPQDVANKVAAQQQQQAAYWASQSQKNFEAAYGDLASRYGFGGGAPSPKSRKAQ
ncbi:hypothetical protein D9756_009901 [Leucocoprinus leucothites]|uniref:Uncharacterized protein n=1 Tax=Leucocoprinus leucothites TaxID=201217 RepID=A0A8H5CUD5_9AGAR|nr:hypothetical protein D9756_009901 [Leucoagaricus leucothites]